MCKYLIEVTAKQSKEWFDIMKLKLFNNNKFLKLSQPETLNNTDSQPLDTFNKSLKTTVCISLSILILLFICVALLESELSHHKEVPRVALRPKAIKERVVSCYYNTPGAGDQRQLLPSNIHPHLCTHINVAFAQIKDKQIYLEDHQYKSISEVVSLKDVNPKLKILLSVGGAGEDSGFPAMVENHASRKVFIKSIKSILRNHSLDGIDLDWEFPAISSPSYGSGLRKRQRQHFSQLLREIRMEYIREKRDYLLTVALAAPQVIADVAYDVDQINLYVDYANIMTYDFHYFTEFTPFTGLNSPLYARSTEHLYMATLNINYTVHMYIDKGLDRNKIVVGVPTYGHSFKLVNANNGNVGSPALGYGDLGQRGFFNYPDICHFVKTFHFDVSITFDPEARVPYMHRDHVWASFDNPKSVMEKAKYITENNLRGAMIYSLNADDYEGVCDILTGSTKFPLAVSIKKALNEDEP